MHARQRRRRPNRAGVRPSLRRKEIADRLDGERLRTGNSGLFRYRFLLARTARPVPVPSNAQELPALHPRDLLAELPPIPWFRRPPVRWSWRTTWGFDVGHHLVGGLVAIPASIAGLVFATFLDRKMPIPMRKVGNEEEKPPLGRTPSCRRSGELLLPVILPVISVNTVAETIAKNTVRRSRRCSRD